MEKLSYNYEVFESGAGRIYTILSRASMPALILGVALMMTINSGMFTGFANLPDFVKILFMAVIILYIVPGIFVFPTVWMLRSWKTRSLKNCYVMAGRTRRQRENISYMETYWRRLPDTRAGNWRSRKLLTIWRT